MLCTEEKKYTLNHSVVIQRTDRPDEWTWTMKCGGKEKRTLKIRLRHTTKPLTGLGEYRLFFMINSSLILAVVITNFNFITRVRSIHLTHAFCSQQLKGFLLLKNPLPFPPPKTETTVGTSFVARELWPRKPANSTTDAISDRPSLSRP